jgi:hypothetical protein
VSDQSVKLPRLFADDDGESHVEDLEIPIHGTAELRASAEWPASNIHFIESEGTGELFHGNAPRRKPIALLQGGLEVESTDGMIRRIEAGEMLLADDTAGKGHILRGLPGSRRALFITLPTDLDLTGFRK